MSVQHAGSPQLHHVRAFAAASTADLHPRGFCPIQQTTPGGATGPPEAALTISMIQTPGLAGTAVGDGTR